MINHLCSLEVQKVNSNTVEWNACDFSCLRTSKPMSKHFILLNGPSLYILKYRLVHKEIIICV